jgi:copper ion binding protein
LGVSDDYTGWLENPAVSPVRAAQENHMISNNSAETIRHYRVTGMTCNHCASAVEREVGALDGVTGVTVDLPTGDVVVASTRPIAHDEITAAIDEAGYQLAS